MLRYNREAHGVVVDPMSITLAPLLKIWTSDVTTHKFEANRILTYVHLVSQIDQDAPYARADPDDVGKLIKKELWGDMLHIIDVNGINEEFVEECVLHYQSAYEGSEDASVRSFDAKIYEIRNIIDTTTIEIKPSTSRGVTTYVTNFTIIEKMMMNVTKLIKARDELKALILKQNTRDTIKGGNKLSFADKRRKELLDASRRVVPGDSSEALTPEEVSEL